MINIVGSESIKDVSEFDEDEVYKKKNGKIFDEIFESE